MQSPGSKYATSILRVIFLTNKIKSYTREITANINTGTIDLTFCFGIKIYSI